MSASVDNNGTSSITQLSSLNSSSLDIESRMLGANMTMLDNVNKRMSDQLDAMDKRNAQAASLRTVMADASAVSAQFPPNADPTATIPEKPSKSPPDPAVTKLAQDMQEAQIPGYTSLGSDGSVKKSDIDSLMAKLNGMMDTATTTQQSDMLILQSTSSKRDQLFDLMSTFTKKCQDSRSSIIRNF